MHEILRKTFGGLTYSYYFRQLFFGFLFCIAVVWILWNYSNRLHPALLIIYLINTLLYPYSSFVIESTNKFIKGNTVIYHNLLTFLFIKYFKIAFCWSFAIIIGPVGLVYLYNYHTKMIRDANIDDKPSI